MKTIKRLSFHAVEQLAFQAARIAGFNEVTSQCLGEATAEAELHNKSAVGLSHLFDYFAAIDSNLINLAPRVTLRNLTRSMFIADADDGPMQFAFTQQESNFVEATRDHGVAILTITNAFAGGELGFYARRLARQSIFSISAVNSPAVMSYGGSTDQVLGTNPLCYGAPLVEGTGIIVDQASSNTALVSMQQFARDGTALPDDWAIDANGHMTNDPAEALAGVLLPFGGYKGANIAMLVELLAMLSGANPSLQAASYYRGEAPPRIGGTIIGIDVTKFEGYTERIQNLLRTFESTHGSDVRLIRDLYRHKQHIEIADDVVDKTMQFIAARESVS